MTPLQLFYELLLVSTGARDRLSAICSDEEWEGALAIAKDQTVAGYLFSAIEGLPREQYPTKYPTIHWWQTADAAERGYEKMDEAGKTAIRYFRDKGFPCWILKGTSVARYYPNPSRRTCGDVDIWLDGGRARIYDLARSFDKEGKLYGVNYHHIHYHLIDDVHLEVHIYPSYLSSPLRNRRLHSFFRQYLPSMETEMPPLAFDRVFILLHCYRHICGHGVGFRQIMDYYYVLRQGFTEEERLEAVEWIGQLGMTRFARGIMWLLQEHMGLPFEYQLLNSDRKEGLFILNEILLTGNMGHSDSRDWGSASSPLSRFFLNLRRDIYLARHYPHEALWQPFFSIWLYFWRLLKGLQ